MANNQTQNLYSVSYKEAKEYLEFIDNIFCQIEMNKQIYNDFDKALTEQKSEQNLFVLWCKSNYYDCLVLNLCKLLEPRKDDKNKYTLKHFINLMKFEINQKMLKKKYESKVINVYHINTGKIDEENVEAIYLERLGSKNFDNDIKEVEQIHNKIVDYRNKQLCHNEKAKINIDVLPPINELHKDVEKIESIFKSYFSLFGAAVNYDNLKTQNLYGNFKLYLR